MKRYLLEIKVNKKNQSEMYYALNELRLDQGLQAQVIHVYINDVLFEVFRGNGLCVSTPSGSTAYNKSLGGAIIYPGIPLPYPDHKPQPLHQYLLHSPWQ